MSAIVAPSRAATSASRSRAVSGLLPPANVAAARLGSTTRSPRATRRTASANCSAGASFTTNPSAPDSIARRKYPARPKVVTISTRQLGSCARSAAAAASPSRPGISTSKTATSGRTSRAAATTSSPRPTWATTSRSGSRLSKAANAPRTRCWSSAIRTRITWSRRNFDAQPEAARTVVDGSGEQSAAQRVGSLGKACEAIAWVRGLELAGLGHAPGSVIDDLDAGRVQRDAHRGRLAVPHDVRHGFANHPAEEPANLRRHALDHAWQLSVDTGRLENLARGREFGSQPHLAIAGNRRSNVGEAFPREHLDFGDLRSRTGRILIEQPRSQRSLHGHGGERVTEQVVQV